MTYEEFKRYVPVYEYRAFVEIILTAIETEFFKKRKIADINDIPELYANKLNDTVIFDLVDKVIIRCNYIKGDGYPAAKYVMDKNKKIKLNEDSKVEEIVIDVVIFTDADVFYKDHYRFLFYHELIHFFDDYASLLSKKSLYDKIFGKNAPFDYNKAVEIINDEAGVYNYKDSQGLLFDYRVCNILYILFTNTETNAYIGQAFIEFKSGHINNINEFSNYNVGMMAEDLYKDCVPVVVKSPILLRQAYELFNKSYLAKRSLNNTLKFNQWFISESMNRSKNFYNKVREICQFYIDSNDMKIYNEALYSVYKSSEILYEYDEHPLMKEYTLYSKINGVVEEIHVKVDMNVLNRLIRM